MADMWHVTGQNLDTEISDTGTGFEPVWSVSYTVDTGPAKGTNGKVTIPVRLFNADAVKSAIDEAVGHLDAVAKL